MRRFVVIFACKEWLGHAIHLLVC